MRNLRLWLAPPTAPQNTDPPRTPLPAPGVLLGRVEGTPLAEEILRLAGEVLAGRIPLFDTFVPLGAAIPWRQDWGSGRSSGLDYFRRVPYLDPQRIGDHKRIWEPNRHQHLVLLAQAFLLTAGERYIEELWRQLESWIEDNPFARGINWTSALEVALRALSWLWIDHLCGPRMPPLVRRTWSESLYRHGCYLENNLSVYFSPNTHLLGEALALHALGVAYPAWPHAAHWRDAGAAVLDRELEQQVRPDGSHIEQSAYYHVYTLDMFLLHSVLRGPALPARYRERIRAMAFYLDALLGESRRLPLIGDDDGGRLFHPYGSREHFAEATLTAAGLDGADRSLAIWWLPELPLDPPLRPAPQSRLFEGAGVAVLCAGGVQIIADAGPFGPWGGGHSHSDSLSLVLRQGSEEILIDPGTYTYLDDATWRDRFRGSGAHSTIRIDGQDQAIAVNPFRWEQKPETAIERWQSSVERDELTAVCRHHGFEHCRRLRFVKPHALLVLDEISGPPGEHRIEQIWHFGSQPHAVGGAHRVGARAWLAIAAPHTLEVTTAWRSRCFHSKEESWLGVVRTAGPLPLRLAALWSFDGPGSVALDDGCVEWNTSDAGPHRLPW